MRKILRTLRKKKGGAEAIEAAAVGGGEEAPREGAGGADAGDRGVDVEGGAVGTAAAGPSGDAGRAAVDGGEAASRNGGSATKADASAEAPADEAEAPVGKAEASAGKVDADRADADKASADKASADKASADKAEAPADKASADKADADKAEAPADKAEAPADKADADKADADKAEAPADKADADKADADKAEAPADKAEAPADKADADKASADKAEAPANKADAPADADKAEPSADKAEPSVDKAEAPAEAPADKAADAPPATRAPEEPSPPAARKRVHLQSLDGLLRVFLSSTFRDMAAERDELGKNQLPKLAARCRMHGITLTEIDLRWGVTEAEATSGQVVAICLAEIDRSQLFVSLLGSRYGWIPDKLDATTMAAYPWLDPLVGKISVTEMEILHGALRPPGERRAERSFFYLRDMAYADTQPEDVRSNFASESDAARTHQLALRQRCCDSGHPWKEYKTPAECAELVLADLMVAFDEMYPGKATTTWLDAQRDAHASFARSRTVFHIPRDAVERTLSDYVSSPRDQPLLVLGAPGSGKTATLAHFANVTAPSVLPPDSKVIDLYTSASKDAQSVDSLASALIGMLNADYDLPLREPSHRTDAARKLPDFVRAALEKIKGHLVLVFDGLNQLIAPGDSLVWLSFLQRMPKRLHVICSTQPNTIPHQAMTKTFEPTIVTMSELDHSNRAAFVDGFLAVYSKRLNDAQHSRVVAASGTASPLYTRLFLEEVRLFGSFEHLDAFISGMLSTDSAPALFKAILERCEADFNDPERHPNLVRDVVVAIYLSSDGLTEQEIIDFVGISRAVWSPLFLSLSEVIYIRSGRLQFAHDQLAQAVAERFLGQDELASTHLRMAAYFNSQPDRGRFLSQTPYHLIQARDWAALRDHLVHTRTLYELYCNYGTSLVDTISVWVALIKSKAVDCEDALIGAADRILAEADLSIEARALIVDGIAATLGDLGMINASLTQHARAIGLLLRSMDVAVEAGSNIDFADLASRLDLVALEKAGHGIKALLAVAKSVASGLGHASNYQAAIAYHRQLMRYYEYKNLTDSEAMAQTCNNMGVALARLRQDEEALAMYERARDLHERITGKHSETYADAINNIGVLYGDMGNMSMAYQYASQSLDIYRAVLGDSSLMVAYATHNLAKITKNFLQDFPEAQRLYLESIELKKMILGDRHFDVSYGLINLASLCMELDRYDLSLQHSDEAIGILEEALGDKPSAQLVMAVANKGLSLHHLGRSGDAIPELKRALDVSITVFGEDHPEVVRVRANYSLPLVAEGRLDEALTQLLASAKIMRTREAVDQSFLRHVFARLAQLHSKMGNQEPAADLYQDLMSRKLLFRGMCDGAEEAFKATGRTKLLDEVRKIREREEVDKDLEVKLIRAQQFLAEDKILDAIPLLEAIYEVKPDFFNTTLKLGYCYAVRHRSEDALRVFTKAVEFMPDDPDAHLNLALSTAACGRPRSEIDEAFSRALNMRVSEQAFGSWVYRRGEFSRESVDYCIDAVTKGSKCESLSGIKSERERFLTVKRVCADAMRGGFIDMAIELYRELIVEGKIEDDEAAERERVIKIITMMADTCIRDNRWAQAEGMYGEVVELWGGRDAAPIGIVSNIGVCALRQDELDRAIDWFQVAHGKQPEDMSTRQNLAICLCANKRWAEALPHWLHLVEGNSRASGALIEIGRCFAMTGKLDQSKEALEHALDVARRENNPVDIGKAQTLLDVLAANEGGGKGEGEGEDPEEEGNGEGEKEDKGEGKEEAKEQNEAI